MRSSEAPSDAGDDPQEPSSRVRSVLQAPAPMVYLSSLISPGASVSQFTPAWPGSVSPPALLWPGPLSCRAPGARTDPSEGLVKLFSAPQMIWTDQRLSCCALSPCFLFLKTQELSSENVKTTRRCKKDLPLQELAERALNEYSQVMDTLGSKVSEGSEVTEEEDVCAPYLEQLLDDTPSLTETGLDMDFINSLLSSDVSKDGFEADSSLFNGSDLLSQDPMMEDTSARFQNNVFTSSQTFTEPLFHTDLNTSVQETDTFETLCVDELDSAAQSICFSLQNYKSHHATFPPTLKLYPEPPQTLLEEGLEKDGEENALVEPEKYMNAQSTKDNNKINLDIPDESQRTLKYDDEQTNREESPKTEQIEENNVNEYKKLERQPKRRKIVTRTSFKLDDKDEKKVKNVQRKSASATRHEVEEREIDFVKIKVKKVKLQNISEATSSGMCTRLRQRIRRTIERRTSDVEGG